MRSRTSGGGNGILGIGWDLAVPFIARQLDKGMPTYADPSGGLAKDRFKYNGGPELVQILSSAPGEQFQLAGVCVDGVACGPSGWLYCRARVEGAFLRFFMRADGRQWRVQDKNGTCFYFGVVDDHPDVPASRTEASLVSFHMDDGTASGADVVYRWNLTRMTDAGGNDVWYFYEKNGNQSYLRHVTGTRRSRRCDFRAPSTTSARLRPTGRMKPPVRERLPAHDGVAPAPDIVETVVRGAVRDRFAHTRTYLFLRPTASDPAFLQLFGKDCLTRTAGS